jgi:hypothetical protein
MADADKSGAGPTRLFIVETTTAGDALLRVLSAVAYAAAPGGGTVRIEAAGLGEAAALRLASRLQSEPVVTEVTAGWRAQP